MNRSILPLVLFAGLTVPAVITQPAAAVEGSPMLLHGNYCGPGNRAPAAPVDALDAACARHDACTPDGALAPKACNLRLQVDAERVAADPRQPPDLRMLAGLVASGAAMMPSAPSATPRAPSAVPASVDVGTQPDADLLPDDE